MAHVEFFFDLSSPWTRIAFHCIQPILAETGANITYRPILVGAVFNHVNTEVYAKRVDTGNAKLRPVMGWMLEWAELAGVPMNFPSPLHPLKSVHAMRSCCVLEQDQPALMCFMEAAFTAYFRDQRNLDDPAEIAAVANEAGLNGAELSRQASAQSVKDALRANTQELIDRGGFGSPTMFVEEKRLYFGNDQLPLVRAAILKART